jgi:hypothetical protein
MQFMGVLVYGRSTLTQPIELVSTDHVLEWMGRRAQHRARALRVREERLAAEGGVRGRRHVQPGERAGRHELGPDPVRQLRHAPRDHAQRRPRRRLAAPLLAGHRAHERHRRPLRPRWRSAPQLPLCQLTYLQSN